MRTPWLSLSLAACLAATSACRGSSADRPDAGPGIDAPGGSQVSIQQVQDPDMPVGTAVTLRGVVIIAIDTYGGRTGGVYVMEPEGGPFSGIFLFLSGTQAAGFAVGDLVDVTGGVKEEFAWSTDDSGRSLTQIVAPQGGQIALTKVGDGTVPEPEVLDPWALADDDDEAEKWASVLIRFEDVRVLRRPQGVSQSDATLTEMLVTGPFLVNSGLTALVRDDIEFGDCYSSITGIGDYFLNYKLLPRGAGDLVAGGEDCLPPEQGAAACSDGIDNDYNGYTDCDDFGCQATHAACGSTSVVDVANGTVANGADVFLSNVVVTGLNYNRKQLWVQDSGGAVEYNGIFVHRGPDNESTAPLPADIVVGAVVDVSGRTTEFNGMKQLSSSPTVTLVSDDGAPEVLAGVDWADLVEHGASAPYHNVLVTIENVEVTRLDGARFYVGGGAVELRIGNFIYSHPDVEVGDCYAAITGIVDRVGTEMQLLPRSDDDLILAADAGDCD